MSYTTSNRSEASTSGTTKEFSAERILDVLRHAQDEVERKVTAALHNQSSAARDMKRALEEANARCGELQKEIDRLTTQKNYVADAFENSRKETARLKAENQLADEENQRLRKAVEELQAERVASGIGKKAVDADLAAVEVERDVIARALGEATNSSSPSLKAHSLHPLSSSLVARPLSHVPHLSLCGVDGRCGIPCCTTRPTRCCSPTAPRGTAGRAVSDPSSSEPIG